MDLITVNKFNLEINRGFLGIRQLNSGRERANSRKLTVLKWGLIHLWKGFVGCDCLQ